MSSADRDGSGGAKVAQQQCICLTKRYDSKPENSIKSFIERLTHSSPANSGLEMEMHRVFILLSSHFCSGGGGWEEGDGMGGGGGGGGNKMLAGLSFEWTKASVTRPSVGHAEVKHSLSRG